MARFYSSAIPEPAVRGVLEHPARGGRGRHRRCAHYRMAQQFGLQRGRVSGAAVRAPDRIPAPAVLAVAADASRSVRRGEQHLAQPPLRNYTDQEPPRAHRTGGTRRQRHQWQSCAPRPSCGGGATTMPSSITCSCRTRRRSSDGGGARGSRRFNADRSRSAPGGKVVYPAGGGSLTCHVATADSRARSLQSATGGRRASPFGNSPIMRGSVGMVFKGV